MWEGIQPELQPHHSQPKTQGRPALPLSSLPLWLPAQGGPAATPGAPLQQPMTGQSPGPPPAEIHSGQKDTDCVVVMMKSSLASEAKVVKSGNHSSTAVEFAYSTTPAHPNQTDIHPDSHW